MKNLLVPLLAILLVLSVPLSKSLKRGTCIKKLLTPLLAVALILSFLFPSAHIPSAPGTLLKLAGLPPYCIEKIVFRDYWTDLLQYCDGRDILVFRSKKNLTAELDEWTHVSSVTYEKIEQLAPRELATRYLEECEASLPDSYTAYFLKSPFEKGEDFHIGDEFIIGLYDAKSRICLLYRGHHLHDI